MEQNTNQAPTLALSDLVLLLNLIKATAERGAIRAEEMAEVGAVYIKLLKFLESSGAINRAPNTPESTEDSTLHDPAAAI